MWGVPVGQDGDTRCEIPPLMSDGCFPTDEAIRYFKAYSVIRSRGLGYDYPHPFPDAIWDQWVKENSECTDAWVAWVNAMESDG